MRKSLVIAVTAGLLALPGGPLLSQARDVPCDPDNGGLTLPAGFCATVFAERIGAGRHAIVAANGDVLVNTDAPRSTAGSAHSGGGVMLLRDTDADGKAEWVQRLGGNGGTGIAIAGAYLYAATGNAIVRWSYAPGLTELGVPDTVVSGLYADGHAAGNFEILGDTLYLNVGSLTNSCQESDGRPRSKGIDPCLELGTRGGIWEYAVNRVGQAVRLHFQPRSGTLREAVSTGTVGATARREVGHAVASVDANRDSSRSRRELPDAIGGGVAGVTILRNDGSVGTGESIRMRGVNSFRQGSRPLFYVDGVRVFNDLLPTTVAQQSSSPLNDINPDDIERIEIIKGSAATALYGTEGSNGVIHVFTKRGAAARQPQWDVTLAEAESVASPQVADGGWFATGIHDAAALAVDPRDGALWAAMSGRDQLAELWGFPVAYGAGNPGEQVSRVRRGDDFGWPYCYFSVEERKLVTAPEYGGDGRKSDRCDDKRTPGYVFPSHWAPGDMLFYTGSQFPRKYYGGAIIAFHGGNGRAPLQLQGFNVTFQPMQEGKASGPYEVLAGGFTGKPVLSDIKEAAARPMGLAQGPDGSLYVSDSIKGKIWRILYRGLP